MIVFDQDAIAERRTVVRSPAKRHSPFLKRSPAWESLSCIHNIDWIAMYGMAEAIGQGGDSGEMLEEVQGDSLCHQDGPTIAINPQ
jgi:hypothetical protein